MTERVNEFDGRPDLVKKRARMILWTRIGIGILCFYVLATITLVTWITGVSVKSRSVLLDCTQPTGKCYQEGQQKTGAYIQQLIAANHNGDVKTQEVSVYAAICSSRPQNAGNAVLIQACIKAQQNKDNK